MPSMTPSSSAVTSQLLCCLSPRKSRQRPHRHHGHEHGQKQRHSKRTSSSDQSQPSRPIRLVDRTRSSRGRFPISTDSHSNSDGTSSAPTVTATTIDAMTVGTGMTADYGDAHSSSTYRRRDRDTHSSDLATRSQETTETFEIGDEGGRGGGMASIRNIFAATIAAGEKGGTAADKVEEDARELVKGFRAVVSRVRGDVARDGSTTNRTAKSLPARKQGQQSTSPDMEDHDGRILESQSLYDSDAVAVITPRSTWGHQQYDIKWVGQGEMSLGKESMPRNLSHVLDRSMSPLPPSHKERERKDVEQSYAATAAAVGRSAGSLLAGMLTRRMDKDLRWSVDNIATGSAHRGSQDSSFAGKSQVAPPKFIFKDGDSDERPSGEKSTVATKTRSGKTSGERQRSSTEEPKFERTNTIIWNSPVASRGILNNWRWPFSPTKARAYHGNASSVSSPGSGQRSCKQTAPDAESRGNIQGTKTQQSSLFGGVDGLLRDISVARRPGGKGKTEPSISATVHASSRPPGRNLLVSVSMPAMLSSASDQGEDTQENTTDLNSAKRRVSFAGFPQPHGPSAPSSSWPAATVPALNDDVKKPRSTDTSKRTRQPVKDPSFRLKAVSKITPESILSVPAANAHRINFERLERSTHETSFHSSHESLTNRELAASETRILSRAKTVSQPKSSWFKEDFEDVARQIRKTNPIRKSISGYDGGLDSGGGSLRVPSNQSRYSVVSEKSEDGTVSVWEKAIKDHIREDHRLSRTNLGSEAPSYATRGFSAKLKHHREEKKRELAANDLPVPILSQASWSTENLQAQLGAYQLPQLATHEQRGRRMVVEPRTETSRSRSTSASSWARFASHNREQRSPASAGPEDNVIPRDFAMEVLPPEPIVKRRTDKSSRKISARLVSAESQRRQQTGRTMTFGETLTETLKSFYRVGSLEIGRRLAIESRGHRSSISEGVSISTCWIGHLVQI